MDVLRSLRDPLTLPSFTHHISTLLTSHSTPSLIPTIQSIRSSLSNIQTFISAMDKSTMESDEVATGARELLMCIGMVMAGAAMVDHAGWSGREVDEVAARRWGKIIEEGRVGGEGAVLEKVGES